MRGIQSSLSSAFHLHLLIPEEAMEILNCCLQVTLLWMAVTNLKLKCNKMEVLLDGKLTVRVLICGWLQMSLD